MRAIVTGCAGFIGSHLVSRLIADGASVVGIDSFAPTYDTSRRRARVAQWSTRGSFEFIEGDLGAIDLGPHLTDADVVFHLAARPGVRASWADFAQVSASNIFATQRVLDALARASGTHLVFASSSSVYGAAESFPTDERDPLAPISPYGVTKAAGEALVGAYASQFGVSAVSLRYFTVYGPRQRSDMAFTKWIRLALRSEPVPLYGDGSAVRDFTYVADVVEATLLAGQLRPARHEAYNVAGGNPTTVSEVLDLLSEVIGAPIAVETLSEAKGDPLRTAGDTSKLREATGWTPTWILREGLDEQVDWLRRLDS